eukprot:PhF_6_TR19987/c0_g1_i1/m.29161
MHTNNNNNYVNMWVPTLLPSGAYTMPPPPPAASPLATYVPSGPHHPHTPFAQSLSPIVQQHMSISQSHSQAHMIFNRPLQSEWKSVSTPGHTHSPLTIHPMLTQMMNGGVDDDEEEKVQAPSPLPSERFGHTAVVYGNKMYVHAGRARRCVDDMWACDMKTMKWEPVPYSKDSPVPCARAGHTACLAGHYMYMFGGVGDPAAATPTVVPYYNDLWRLHIPTMTWECIALNESDNHGVPPPRKGHTAVVYKNAMYVCGGGQDDMTMYNDLWRIDLKALATDARRAQWEPITLQGEDAAKFVPRMYHIAVMVDDGPTMVLFGGRAANCKFLNDLFTVDMSTFHVTIPKATGRPPSPRMCSTAIYHNNVVAIFTGGAYSYLPDCHQLDLRSMRWNTIVCGSTNMLGRTRPTTVKHGDAIVMFGGCVSENGYVNDTLVMRLQERTLRDICVEWVKDKVKSQDLEVAHHTYNRVEALPEHLRMEIE